MWAKSQKEAVAHLLVTLREICLHSLLEWGGWGVSNPTILSSSELSASD